MEQNRAIPARVERRAVFEYSIILHVPGRGECPPKSPQRLRRRCRRGIADLKIAVQGSYASSNGAEACSPTKGEQKVRFEHSSISSFEPLSVSPLLNGRTLPLYITNQQAQSSWPMKFQSAPCPLPSTNPKHPSSSTRKKPTETLSRNIPRPNVTVLACRWGCRWGPRQGTQSHSLVLRAKSATIPC